MIGKMTSRDIGRVAEIWLQASIQAHDFVSADFWRSAHRTMTKDLLREVEGYVHVAGGKIDGFVAVADDIVHCLFVEPDRQGHGIGSSLLSYVKRSRRTLWLKVYRQNPDAKRFYESQGFRVIGHAICPHTGCAEFEMKWSRGDEQTHPEASSATASSADSEASNA
jgi:putative acetyltransferase